MRRAMSSVIAAAVVASIAAACGSVKEPTTPAPSSSEPATSAAATTSASTAASTSAAAPSDATFTYATGNTVITTFDPGTSYSNEVIALTNVYEQLTHYDAESKTVVPMLADSWESSPDGKTWTFTLHPGVTFHTGNPLTAAAAKAAIERTIELKAGAAYIWDAVESIDAPDDATLIFHLKYPAALDLIASSQYAAHIYDTTAAGSGDLAKWFEEAHDAGTGPYTVSVWKKGDQNELRLEAYPDYWRGWDGAHYQHLLYQYVPEATTRAQQLEAGDVTFSDRLSPELFAAAQSGGKLATAERSSFQNLIAFLNTANGPLADANVRQAVAGAIDYDGIVAALKGAAVPASGFIPDGLLGYDASLTLAQRVDEAKQQLADAGYGPGGKKISLVTTISNGDADQKLVATLLKSNLAQIGVDLEVKPLEWTTQWGQAKSKDPAKRQDIFIMYWWPDYADPYSWFINLFKTTDPPFFNMSYYSDAEVDKTIDALPSLTATDRDGANTSYVDLQKKLLDEAVAIPLYVINYQRVFQQTVQGYADNPAYANVVYAYDLTPTA